MTGTWLRKGNLKGETESLLIPTQKGKKKTNYVEAKIDYIQKSNISKSWLFGDRDATVDPIINEYRKLVEREYQNGQDRFEKVILMNCPRN